MKAFMVLCLVFAVGGISANNVHLVGTQKEIANKVTLECAKESGVKSDVLSEAQKGQYSDNPGLKKFIYCFFKKIEIINDEGKLNLDTALAKLPPSIDKVEAAKILEQCENKTGKDPVETAYEIFSCYNKATNSHILF